MWMLSQLSLPASLQRSGATLLLALAFGGLSIAGDLDLGADMKNDSWYSIGARIVLVPVMIMSATAYGFAAQRNQSLISAGEEGRAKHQLVADRWEQVKELEESDLWKAHFRSSSALLDSLWRYRHTPARQHALIFLQACSLLVWSFIIRPNCDAGLGVGAAMNVLYLIWKASKTLYRISRRAPEDPVDAWWESLPDADGSEEQFVEDDAGGAVVEPEPESKQDVDNRRKIERMREAQEPRASSMASWVRVSLWLSLLGACMIELSRRHGLLKY
jgi:hypothetical protein